MERTGDLAPRCRGCRCRAGSGLAPPRCWHRRLGACDPRCSFRRAAGLRCRDAELRTACHVCDLAGFGRVGPNWWALVGLCSAAWQAHAANAGWIKRFSGYVGSASLVRGVRRQRMSASRPVEHPNAAEFNTAADDVFGRIASRYDLLCDLFSFWIHRHWKRRVALLVASQPWRDLLDSASGTGDIVIRVLGRQPSGVKRRVVASDISPQMLAIARERLERLGHGVELRQLDAHSMPSVPADATLRHIGICSKASTSFQPPRPSPRRYVKWGS